MPAAAISHPLASGLRRLVDWITESEWSQLALRAASRLIKAAWEGDPAAILHLVLITAAAAAAGALLVYLLKVRSSKSKPAE